MLCRCLANVLTKYTNSVVAGKLVGIIVLDINSYLDYLIDGLVYYLDLKVNVL